MCDFTRAGVCNAPLVTPFVNKKEIRWQVAQETPDIKGEQQIKALKRAFLQWALVIPVKFKYVKPTESADITIVFSRTDPYFSEHKNALAYAWIGTFTQPIDLIFNDAYIWVLNIKDSVNSKYNVEIVAIHEIGHLLGLIHSQNSNFDCMWPVYNGIADLSPDDIARCQKIWGSVGGWQRRLIMLKAYLDKTIQ